MIIRIREEKTPLIIVATGERINSVPIEKLEELAMDIMGAENNFEIKHFTYLLTLLEPVRDATTARNKEVERILVEVQKIVQSQEGGQ